MIVAPQTMLFVAPGRRSPGLEGSEWTGGGGVAQAAWRMIEAVIELDDEAGGEWALVGGARIRLLMGAAQQVAGAGATNSGNKWPPIAARSNGARARHKAPLVAPDFMPLGGRRCARLALPNDRRWLCLIELSRRAQQQMAA